jgi:hypothetical protein
MGTPTKSLTVDPNAPPGAPGLTNLNQLTYSQAEQRLDELSTITLPVSIPGLELIDVDNVQVGSNDAGRSLSLTGSADLPALDGSVDLLVTAIWPDDTSTEPKLSIAAKTDDLALSEVNSSWNSSYGDVRFSTARMAVSTATQDIDPDALPESARAFYSEPVTLTSGVNFAGELEVSGRLADAFGYTGHSGNVELEGSLSASAAALFGHATQQQLGEMNLKATLHKSPTAPAWIADRTSTYTFSTTGIRLEEDVTLAVDGTTNRFRGSVSIPATGDIEGELALVGALDAPYGLDGVALSDVNLRIARGGGALAFDVTVDGSPIHVSAAINGTSSAEFSVDGDVNVPRIAALGNALLGTSVAPVPGADGISLDHISFTFSSDVFSVGARTRLKGINADAVLTLRRGAPLLSLRVNDVKVSQLLPGAGDMLGDVRLPKVALTATTLSRLATSDMTAQERAFFGDSDQQFTPGVDFDATLPLDALGVREAIGHAPGAEVALSGTLGANVTLNSVNSSSQSLRELALSATLPKTSLVLPSWVSPSGPTTLSLRYVNGSIAASFATAANVSLNGTAFSTTIDGRLARTGQRTTIGFKGSITNWRNPFGISWINSLDEATVNLDTSFGGGQPATVDASVTASQLFGGKRFELEFALSRDSSTSASLTARFADRARLREILSAFPNLSNAANEVASKPGLGDLEIGPVTVSATTGTTSTFDLTAATTFRGLESDLLVAVRPGGAFTVGVKAKGTIDLHSLTSQAPSLNLPSAAMVLSSQSGRINVQNLTDGEFDFYKSLYGCSADATRASCAQFREIELEKALKFVAAFDMGDKVETMASAIGIQTTGNIRLEGKLPVFGGNDFSLRASLGNFQFAQQPDWFHSGDVALEINTEGLKFVGGLRVKIEREGWTKTCDGLLINYRCYDLLDFRISAGVTSEKLTLAGTLTTENPWRNAFGQEWLEISRVALQLGVRYAGPEVTMGFQGDIKIGNKDIAAALKVGLAPAPPPAFVRPNLIGFSAASKAGLSLSDLIWLNEKLTGTKLSTDGLPKVSLRNLFLQYSQETDNDLCLKQGVRFNADLYVGNNLPAVEAGTLDPNGCRRLDVEPETSGTCLAQKANGCLASVYGRLDNGGVIAGAELNGFTLGPVTFNDALLGLTLTPTKQQLRVKGGLRIASGSYEFAKGQADLDISTDGLKFKGDAALFNQRMQGFIEANASLNLSNPSFRVKGWLRDSSRSSMDNLVSSQAQSKVTQLRALRPVLNLMTGGGSLANVSALKSKMTTAGLTAPTELGRILSKIDEMTTEIERYGGPALSFNTLLTGLTFDIGTPGVWIPRTCVGYLDGWGTCWGFWTERTCTGTVVNGQCWLIPPARITIPGVCSMLGISGADCSWSGLVRLYVQPAMRSAVQAISGVWVDAGTFTQSLTNVLNRLDNPIGSIVQLQCVYFDADASSLAQGNVNLALATELKLFGQPIRVGARWNFGVTGGSPGEIASAIFRELFSPSSTTCPQMPAAPPADPAQTLTASLSQSTLDENQETSVRITFDQMAMHYPSVTVNWGDGASTTVPAGESRTVTVPHRYVKEGNFPVSVIHGTSTTRMTAVVRNVAPRLHAVVVADGKTVGEKDVVSLRGWFSDPGEYDYHRVIVDWGDGSAPTSYQPTVGAREFDVTHRYADEGNYTVKVTVNDGIAEDSRVTSASVTNVAPSQIGMRPMSNAVVGTQVGHRITFTDPGERDTHTVTVNWGDSQQTFPVPPGLRTIDVPHVYTKAGTHNIGVTVSDDDGGKTTTTVPVTVTK